jgi:hypothetical protein
MIPYDKLCECFRLVRELTPKYREEFEEVLRKLRDMAAAGEDGKVIGIRYRESRAGDERKLLTTYQKNRFTAAVFEPDHDPGRLSDDVAEHPADVVVRIAQFMREKQKAEHWIDHDLDVFDHMCLELLTGPTLKHAVREAARDVSIVGDQERSDPDEGPIEELGA